MIQINLLNASLTTSLNLGSKAHRFITKILFYAIPLIFAVLFAFSCTSEIYFDVLKPNLFDFKAILVSDNGFEILTYFCKCLSAVFVLGSVVFFLLSLPLRTLKRKLIEEGFPEGAFTLSIIVAYLLLFIFAIYLIGIYIHF